MDCESGMISSETQRIQVLESFAVLSIRQPSGTLMI